tara:strand:- start:222 stop:497 length:276 start_codon:yes stop_codon:yes gene_type:complete
MVGSNYPPGVTGNEYEIAGPDLTWEDQHYCDDCEKYTEFDFESFRKIISGRCAVCSNEIDLGTYGDYFVDPDRQRDEQMDKEEDSRLSKGE